MAVHLHIQLLLYQISARKGKLPYFVKSLEVFDWWGSIQIIWKLVLQVSNEHSKLCSPISHMVQPEVGNKNA